MKIQELQTILLIALKKLSIVNADIGVYINMPINPLLPFIKISSINKQNTDIFTNVAFYVSLNIVDNAPSNIQIANIMECINAEIEELLQKENVNILFVTNLSNQVDDSFNNNKWTGTIKMTIICDLQHD